MTTKENLYNGRIVSIDAFRGITILVMIFVNELAGVSNVPQWMKHMPADADAMTFVDLVFPAFLFIVGMSVPFAFNARLSKGDQPIVIWKHTLKRSLALIVMGLFMVNAEYGYNEAQMLISPALWAFFAYTLPIPVWNKYSKEFPTLWKSILQYGGILGFVVLYFLYIQDNGQVGMTQKWWGILGLIGWAYLFTVVFYWFTNGNLKAMIAFFIVSILANCLIQTDGLAINELGGFKFIGGHLIHATLVSAGVIISLLFFDGKKERSINWEVIGFGLLFFLAGYLLRPYFEVSKIRGTPSWTLYSAGLCTFIYYGFYWLMETKKKTEWSDFFMPAAANPLLIYILPGIIIYFNRTVGLSIIPDYFNSGIPGILYCTGFSILMLYLMKVFNKFNIRLHL
ncbi:DUF5009 domain-containing protein [Reichenbachiella sp.]|uniref:DUF5009 domain-containing protein n=1 Tax=Reichenbachiella sp. TaxID=2184521 RepID=UPI003B59F80E